MLRPVATYVFVVSSTRPDTFRNLAGEFADDPAVQVVMERRITERRRSAAPAPTDVGDRRRGERRIHRPARNHVAFLGYAFVRIDDDQDPDLRG